MGYEIETRGLTKRFHYGQTVLGALKGNQPEAVLALDGVSIQVQRQDILGLVGPNSSGKTTLINILCTGLVPSEGEAFVGGFDVTKQAASARPLIGLVTSNERSFYWRLTGRENLRFFAALYELPTKTVLVWIDELIDSLDLKPFADRRFDSYSTGVRQRFAVARALLHKPRILFMDEPTKGLDPISAAKFIAVIRQKIIGTWNPTVLITSHNLKEIEQLCDSLAILQKGRLVCSGRLEELGRKLVPHETYRLSVGNLGENILDALVKLDGVLEVSKTSVNTDVGLAIRLRRGSDVLSAVLRTLLSAGVQIHDCTRATASIEDVFTHTIGQSSEG